MKKYIIILLVLFIAPFFGIAQDAEEVQQDTIVKKVEKLERAAFESSFVIDNPTNVVNAKNALEVQMEHRFGIIETWDDAGWNLGSSKY